MMKKSLMGALVASCLWTATAQAQIYSFEGANPTDGWQAEQAELSVSTAHYKLGKQSMRVAWQPGAVLRVERPQGLEKACKAGSGGVTAWIYNEQPVDADLRVVFQDEAGRDVCQVPFHLDFRGWRALQNRFTEDMGKDRKTALAHMEVRFPTTAQGGVVCLDNVELTRNVSFLRMTDAQVKVNRTDFALVMDFLRYRQAEPDASKCIEATPEQIAVITDRLEQWYLGSGRQTHVWVQQRAKKEKDFIRKGVKASQKYTLTEPLYAMRTPAKQDGEKTLFFMDINKNVLLPLALDYRKNGNEASLKRAFDIYDWFNDQGWADYSALGNLTFEKLRSAGYFHSFFLLRDQMTPEMRRRELNTMRWMTLFGMCYDLPDHPGEVADNLRALALPKLAYALALTDARERQVALTAFRDYMDLSLGYGPGYFGTFKSDGSGYHHRGVYNSAYYPHALYVGALVAYLLHDTPYALSAETLERIKGGLMAFRFLCANLEVPAGTVGRFPTGQEVLQELLPAYAYAALSFDVPDADLLAALKRLTRNHPAQLSRVLDNVNSNLSYTSTVGEAELLAKAVMLPGAPEEAPTGTRFMPYSGLLVVKNPSFHFNVKGFSQYIWDYESSDHENLAGRYLSNGQVEYFDLNSGLKSFNPKASAFDWSYIPGTTSLLMTYDELKRKEHAEGYSDHRNYSDETFLAGVAASDDVALFSFRLHDRAFCPTLRANKTVLFFDDVVMCLGSDVQNADTAHTTLTTLFQSKPQDVPACKKGEVNPADNMLPAPRKAGNGYLLTDHAGITYAVKGDLPRMETKDPFVLAAIDHGKAPQGESYLYYMVTEQGKKMGKKLLSSSSPVQVLRQDNGAHIVRHRTKGLVYAALFDAEATYADVPVTKVNIPLAYIWQEGQQKGEAVLTVCEPDMRRTQVQHMGLLTEESVLVPEEPHRTVLWLQGAYEASCPDGDVRATCADGQTRIEVTTVCGRNYPIRLTAK